MSRAICVTCGASGAAGVPAVRPACVALAAVSLMLGLMASTCGGVLLGWAVVMRRDDLWSVGLPIAVGGLLALLVSTVLQLDRLSGDHRQTVARLEGFNTYLHQIRRDAAEARTLGPMTGGSSRIGRVTPRPNDSWTN